MSNWKHAYGWSGHILVSSDEMDGNAMDNVIAIPPVKFAALAKAHDDATVDHRIETRQLGVTSSGDMLFLATGTSFSEGFKYYGTIFREAEARIDPGPVAVDLDAEYLTAMKEIYGIELPPCRLMIGCASEH